MGTEVAQRQAVFGIELRLVLIGLGLCREFSLLVCELLEAVKILHQLVQVREVLQWLLDFLFGTIAATLQSLALLAGGFFQPFHRRHTRRRGRRRISF